MPQTDRRLKRLPLAPNSVPWCRPWPDMRPQKIGGKIDRTPVRRQARQVARPVLLAKHFRPATRPPPGCGQAAPAESSLAAAVRRARNLPIEKTNRAPARAAPYSQALSAGTSGLMAGSV